MIIYKVTNTINNDFYIGLTRYNIESPMKRHYRKSLNPCTYFHKAIRKYGKENFTWEIIDSDAISINHLKELEIWYIEHLKPEYNLTKGGDGTSGLKWKEESKKKLSISKTGIKMPKEFGEKISLSLSNKKRKPLSEEHKKKLSLIKLGKKGPPSKRKGRRFNPISLEHKQKISKTFELKRILKG